MRLDLLAVATCLADIPATPPTRRHALTGSWAGHFAVDVTANWRLVFRPAPDLVRVHDDGSLDLTSVTGIEIVAIEDYH
jgi:proteic killer suppression protein